jgi:hypothetical protein
VLLAEGSVARAAQRLRLSPSAMSRALARLRATTGDPLLVRAGRGLVPTPRALALRARVGQLVQDGEAVLRPQEKLDLKQLVRTFTLRTSEGFVENFGPDLIARVGKEADAEEPFVVDRYVDERAGCELFESGCRLVVTLEVAEEENEHAAQYQSRRILLNGSSDRLLDLAHARLLASEQEQLEL